MVSHRACLYREWVLGYLKQRKGQAVKEFKGTPGPWQVVPDAQGYSRETAECIVWGPHGPGHGAVANTSTHGMPYPHGRQAADAQAIAAVPDFLDACTGDVEPELWGLCWLEDVLKLADKYAGTIADLDDQDEDDIRCAVREGRVTVERLRAALKKAGVG